MCVTVEPLLLEDIVVVAAAPDDDDKGCKSVALLNSKWVVFGGGESKLNESLDEFDALLEHGTTGFAVSDLDDVVAWISCGIDITVLGLLLTLVVLLVDDVWCINTGGGVETTDGSTINEVSITLPLSVDNCDGDGIKAPLVVLVEGETFWLLIESRWRDNLLLPRRWWQLSECFIDEVLLCDTEADACTLLLLLSLSLSISFLLSLSSSSS